VDELERVFLADHVAAFHRRHFPEQVKDERVIGLLPVRRDVDFFPWRVGDDLRVVEAVIPHLVDGAGEQRVERARDEQLERRDARELFQRRRHRKRADVAQQQRQFDVDLARVATRGHVTGRHRLQRQRSRE
jgi:hypothetical protein